MTQISLQHTGKFMISKVVGKNNPRIKNLTNYYNEKKEKEAVIKIILAQVTGS
jgi:hypothetical protein